VERRDVAAGSARARGLTLALAMNANPRTHAAEKFTRFIDIKRRLTQS